MRAIRLGDTCRIPLGDGRCVFGRFLWGYRDTEGDKVTGDVLEVFSLVIDEDDPIPPLEEIIASGRLFPPILTLMTGATGKDGWRWVYREPVPDIEHPVFRYSWRSALPGGCPPFDDWVLWDGKAFRKVGRLTEDQLELEEIQLWVRRGVVKRIRRVLAGEPWEITILRDNGKRMPNT